MKRSGAIWLVVVVIAVAAGLMYLVVLPQIRDGRAVEEIARKAEETVKDVKQAVNDAGKQVEDVAKGGEEAKTGALAKMARLGQDAGKATDELQTLLDQSTPNAEQLAAAKAKLAAALKEASELKLPADVDGKALAAADKLASGAKVAMAELASLPADPAAAKAALAEIEAKLLATLPGSETVKSADTTQPAATDAGADVAKPADTADAALPAFDILRVEKDGSTVIAGRAEPGAKIEIVDGDKVIASADVDPSGDFAAVLDNPLASGDHTLTLKATTKDGKSSTSEEVATVSVPKDASGELLAMVTKPGEASKIITMPEAENAEIASNKGVTPDASKDATSSDGGTTAQETAAATDPGAKVETPDLPASSSDIASTPPVVAQDDTAGKAEQAAIDSTAAKPAVDQPVQKQPAVAPEVMVSAVELEGDRIFIAGKTRPGATVRLYADADVVAEVRADEGGRFVADGTIKLAIGNHTIRADVLSADGSKVELRASVPFFRPEGDLAAVASMDSGKDKPKIEPLADGAFDKARDEAGKALGLLKGLYADGRVPTAEELAAARSSAEIALESLAAVRVPADVDPSLSAMAAKASQEAGKALDKLKAVPADVAAFKSALGEVETIVTAAVKPASDEAGADRATAADKQQAALAVDKADNQVSADDVQVTAKVDRLAKSTDAAADAATETGGKAAATGGQPASQESALADQPKVIEQAPLKQSDGSVIIRRGDTLWQISRRVYGKGVRYTTIYIANKAQISNPDRILPGQIFTMPGQWLENAEELHKDRMQHRKR